MGGARMIRTGWAAALLLLAAAAPARAELTCRPDPGARYSEAEATRYITAREAEWAASVATNDASVLKRILSDDFVWVLDGRVVDKATAIREAASGPGKFVSNALEYAHVRFFGPVAVVQGSERWVKRDPERKGRFLWTDTWVLCGGEWKIVNAQDTSIRDPGS